MPIVTIVAILSLCVAALSAGIAWYSGTASTKLYVEKKRDPEDEPGTEKWVVVGARRAKERKNASTCSNLLLDKGVPESCARKKKCPGMRFWKKQLLQSVENGGKYDGEFVAGLPSG